MPAHNAEKTVVGAIRSTLAAMEPGDFLILLDDGSTDATNDLAHSVGDPRLRVISSATKSGVSSALNRGIEAAETELIARMDA
ncbi:MAG: putative glycosyltransferase EpsE, partial [Actinomycetota bacterium]